MTRASSVLGLALLGLQVALAVKHLRRDIRTLNVDAVAVNASESQWVHWVFVTDCSAYMYNQGNLMLASAYHVNQPGEFTWIAYGCQREEQKKQMSLLAHPRAKVWHVPETKLIHPKTGKVYRDFQASNRPVAILDWWRKAQPKEEAIGIIDPDETWMRPVHLVKNPTLSSKSSSGPWQTKAAEPKLASAARYGIGCVFGRVPQALEAMCNGDDSCMNLAQSYENCEKSYSSGPPWVLHRDDAEDVYGDWIDNAILMHEAWPDMLAEQGSYGVTQARHGVKSVLDEYWFLSAPDPQQPWSSVLDVSYDPCETRAPPAKETSLPPLWHACSTWEIPHLANQGFRLHKDHIHKDVLECEAPLLHYPPEDALTHYYTNQTVNGQPHMDASDMDGFRNTWSVCTYTNLVNFHAAAYKKSFCDKPNLEPTFSYPGYSQGFVTSNGKLENIFRRGGWEDVDYKIGALLQVGAKVVGGLRKITGL